MKKSIFPLFFLFSILMLTSIVLAVPPACRWEGYVTRNGALCNSSDVIVSYTNDSSAITGTIQNTGYYWINVPGSLSNNNVTFKVNGVYVNQTWQSWSCGGEGYNTLNLSMNTSPNGVACTYDLGCTNGYCVDGYCCNSACTGACNNCNVAGSLGTCTDVNTLCSGTTSSCYCSAGSCVACSSGYTCTNYACVAEVVGGGAALGGGGEVAPAVTTETETISSISAGGTATVTIEKSDDLKIQEISITAASAVSNVQLTVKEVTTLPTAISTPVGVVSKYLNIEKVNIKDTDISKAKIKFKVEKSWTINNNIDISTIALKRWSEDKWNKLATSLLDQDASYYYFEAESPGLSYFAITGEEIKEVPVVKECPTCPSPSEWSKCIAKKQTRTNYRCSAATDYTCESYTEEQACEVKKIIPTVVVEWAPLIVLIVIVILVLGIFYYYKYYKPKKKK